MRTRTAQRHFITYNQRSPRMLQDETTKMVLIGYLPSLAKRQSASIAFHTTWADTHTVSIAEVNCVVHITGI